MFYLHLFTSIEYGQCLNYVLVYFFKGIYVGIENSAADRGESPYAEVAETDQSQRHYVNARRV